MAYVAARAASMVAYTLYPSAPSMAETTEIETGKRRVIS
jgi:hypothetical protein